MNNKKATLTAIGISIAIHIGLLILSGFIELPGVNTIIDKTKQFFNFEGIRKEEPLVRPVKQRGVTYTNTVKFEKPDKYTEVSNAIERDEQFLDKDEMVSVSPNVGKLTKFTSLEEINMDSMSEVKAIGGGHKRQTRKDIVSVTKIKGQEGVSVPKEFLNEPDFSEDFINKMPGITPDLSGGVLDSIRGKVFTAPTRGEIPAVGRKSKFTNLEEYLICELSSYEDPSDKQKYFRLSIRSGKDADKLATMPKEMIFLIDSSLSIQPERLEEFKKGLVYSLSNLNSEDVFNIMAFKDSIIWFKQFAVKADKGNINEALKFVDRLTSNERTDAFQALYEGIKRKASKIPSYVMFFSDGRPTSGITNSRRIINEISKINNGERPVFAFSGGARVNRYLLDFISYRNRGWTEYADRAQMISKNLSKMYDKIKDPLLLNLRYRVSGVDPKQVFPKTLPDFYRNAEFNIYGRYGDNKEFSVQLLGDIAGETNEFIVLAKLDEAKQGTDEIARNWAFTRIYYLIGTLREDEDNAATLKEIDALCKKFDIITPYSEGMQD